MTDEKWRERIRKALKEHCICEGRSIIENSLLKEEDKNNE